MNLSEAQQAQKRRAKVEAGSYETEDYDVGIILEIKEYEEENWARVMWLSNGDDIWTPITDLRRRWRPRRRVRVRRGGDRIEDDREIGGDLR